MADRIKHIRSIANYALWVKIMQQNHVVVDIRPLLQHLTDMQLMQECFYNHFTVFILKKHSRFTRHINEMLAR